MPDVNTPYSLVLLDEYTNTLDALPIELSRNFADLRELDAVLSASISQITAKIHNLTTMIEEGTASKQDRLWILSEIAEEAQRLKLGGEDKIRVACQAADNLKGHSGHLRALTENLPGFDINSLNRNTVYPHVSERSYMPAGLTEGGRRRRNVNSLLVANQADPSPAKRKRANPKEDDVENNQRSPKKPAHGDSHQRNRNNTRVKKTDRAASPSESLVSVTSHLPQQNGATGRSNNSTSHRHTNSTANNNKRRTANNNNNRNTTPLVNESHSNHGAAQTNGSRRGGDAYNVPPSTSHPSLPLPYANGSTNSQYDLGQDWIPPAQQLEGPGMPVARSASIHSTAASVQVAANNAADTTDAGDNDMEDNRTYCICDGVSYGEMIACDDSTCEREWFHLACINLTAPPAGQWYCDSCKAKKNQKRNQRNGKRKAAGRTNAKS
ncbi:hypothetical protein CVT24_005297 [Panaeolus cyanescens]|uniref:Chromatin modification-related protein n=1 Tax=Panaeolus cyanescens TaxID=181874 RepID=A0A409Y959_9AGAR|nr:hypothetical protein CVT24_005297 [Panaeolus cyanescens]